MRTTIMVVLTVLLVSVIFGQDMTTVNAQVPGTPNFVGISYNSEQKQVEISFLYARGALGFNVYKNYKSMKPLTQFGQVVWVSAYDHVIFTDQEVKTDSIPFYWVTAYNQNGESLPSAMRGIAPPPQVPVITSQAISSDQIKWTWVAGKNTTEFFIHDFLTSSFLKAIVLPTKLDTLFDQQGQIIDVIKNSAADSLFTISYTTTAGVQLKVVAFNYGGIKGVVASSKSVPAYGGLGAQAVERELNKGVRYRLNQNYPNPFNPTTEIAYELPEKAHVFLAVYNIAGQLIKVLVEGEQMSGNYRAAWDATDSQGMTVPSGVYFYRLQANGFVQTMKMTLMK